MKNRSWSMGFWSVDIPWLGRQESIKLWFAAFSIAVVNLACCGTLAFGQGLFQQEDIAKQCKQVTQDPDAKWRTIPWQTDLLKAQNMAVESGKPLFVWAMDGHPLGCT